MAISPTLLSIPQQSGLPGESNMARQSILTKFIPASNTRGSRIKAVQSGWSDKRECISVTIAYPYECNQDQAHALAARLLAEKLNWHGRYVAASLGAWSDYAYCFAYDDETAFIANKQKEAA
jgi:hypothetical protein